MTTLLVTGVGGPAGRSLGAQLMARAAAGADLSWVGVDVVAVDDPHFSLTDRAPRADDWAYTSGMLDLLDRYTPDLLVPTVQDELAQIAVLAEALGRAAHRNGTAQGLVLTPAPGPAAIAADKLLTMLALDRAGVAVPRYAQPSDLLDVDQALAWASGPVVIKPRVSRGGRAVRVVESPADLPTSTRWDALDGSWLVQSFAGGTEYCPQLYRQPSGDTTVVVLEKTALKQGRVGNALHVVRVADGAARDIAAIARDTAEALDLVGPVDMDIRRNAAGVPVVLEVNARFGANSALAPELLDAVLGVALGRIETGPR